jgi:transposase InsO family protein
LLTIRISCSVCKSYRILSHRGGTPRQGPRSIYFQGPLRDTILHDNHDAAVSGHRGFSKTLSFIRSSYFSPTLRKDAESCAKYCDTCQRAKAFRQPRGGLSRPFPPQMKKCEVISMDFVFDLPVTSSGKSGIAVIVDKLSRQAHFLSLPPKFDAVYLAHLYLHEIYRHHGLPRVLISDRDVRFTSQFWTALVKRLGDKLNLSTAHHPQTDGQSGNTIGILEDMILPYVCYLQTDWAQYLDQLEFAYNNSVHTSTDQTLFLVTYVQHPDIMDDVLLRASPEREDPPAVQEFMDATERACVEYGSVTLLLLVLSIRVMLKILVELLPDIPSIQFKCTICRTLTSTGRAVSSAFSRKT